ncbi:unnamed protein product [Lymnaea stagnalis]|uniref:Ig-like domain-containing protein n=1 Tax=Lymnaea stagnalis TaxID=6523 RepID=A0AAV2I164_LYMST
MTQLIILVYLLISYNSIIGLGLGLAPILDKSEIGDGENVTVTCDVSRVTESPVSSICYLFISIQNPIHPFDENLAYVWLCDDNLIHLGEGKWPWQTKYRYINGNQTLLADSQIILINNNSTCDDAGVYTCTYAYRDYDGRKAASQTLRRKASCDRTSTTTTTATAKPADSSNSSAHGTNSSAHGTNSRANGMDMKTIKIIFKSVILVALPAAFGISAAGFILLNIFGMDQTVVQRAPQPVQQVALVRAPQRVIRRRNPPAPRRRNNVQQRNLILNRMCTLCLRERPLVSLYPCMHTNICEGCTIKIIEKRNRPCPFCRVRIEGYL